MSPDLVPGVHVHYLFFRSPQMADSLTATQKLIIRGCGEGRRHPQRALTTEVYSKGPEGASVEGKNIAQLTAPFS